ncbi:TlpA family protein disulfide reductase [Pseudorhodobacter sp. E13]|uniref:TlpA disulfide reductase family protein n=1 Tax=Pseudorhodobacter sp. E13 TaxID=2487931 RepID=UPI000F8D6293|nr:TlpA disulfide reductase family protein [Pseudorhodobacter sp. E13]RUS58780.1 TlpA family protein disulfide reductase [Pseudorhodobacter sp. E13]
MLRIVLIVLYTGLGLGANSALADVGAAKAVLDGDMRKLVFHDTAKDLPAEVLTDLEGAERGLAEWQGQWVVLNFWATWCAPCRKEMPSLDRLAASVADKGVSVVTIATGRNPPPAITRFFEEIGVQNLPVLLDPKSALARQMGVLGLPLTVILNPAGQEVARLIGDAEWDSADAKAMIEALIAP